MALLIPITYAFDPTVSFMMLSAALGGSAFGGSVTAILLNIPGDAPNAATVLDGYPLSKQGQANVALGASATASGLGAIIGIVVFVLMIPVMREFLRLFGPPEYFGIAIFGLIAIAIATRESFLNGMIGGGLGLFLSFVGFNSITGGARYTFGIAFLRDGIPLLPTIIGLFAVSEMINLLVIDRTISGESIKKGGNVVSGIKSVFVHYRVFLQSSLIGILVGMIPAAGGSVANFLAYSYAKQSVGDSSGFGHGDIRGVIAPEASNDAKDGGAMIPTITFGIPGSAAWAVMLGAFVLHGIDPGPTLITNNLDVVFIIVFSLIVSNVLTSVIGIVTAEQLSKITLTPVKLLAPTVLIIALIGAYTVRLSILDPLLAAVFGLFGFLMIQYGISRIALIMGLVLGTILENAFHQTLQISRSGLLIFVERPMSLVILVMIAGSLLYMVYQWNEART
jgi:putative tricarboxylic transport membrane protein